MARPKKDEDGSESKAVQLTTKLLKEFGKNYDGAKQKVSDAAMSVATIMRSFHMYLTEFGVYEQLDMLDETPDIRKGSDKTAKSPTHSAASAAAH